MEGDEYVSDQSRRETLTPRHDAGRSDGEDADRRRGSHSKRRREHRGRSLSRRKGERRRRRSSCRSKRSCYRRTRDHSSSSREPRRSRSHSRHTKRRHHHSRDPSHDQGKNNRDSRSRNRRRAKKRHRSHSSDDSGKIYDKFKRIRFLEEELRKERDLRKTTRDSEEKLRIRLAELESDSHNREKPRSETADFLEQFVNIFKDKAAGHRESFHGLHNVIPEFDPMVKEQTIDVWISKVDECADIYSWNDKQTIHYALPKLVGHAKTWYQGLPSIKHSWSEWKQLLKESFPSTESFAELLTEMLSRRACYGDSLELYYYTKINLLNRCKVFGRDAVDCLIFGVEDKGVRLSAQAGKFEKPEEVLEFFKSIKTQAREGIEFKKDSIFEDKWSSNTSSSNNSNQTSQNNDLTKARPRTGPIVCFNCNQSGHPSFKCPKPINKCSECNFFGHSSTDCPKKTNNMNKDNSQNKTKSESTE